MKQILVLKEPAGKITQAKDLFKRIKKINIDYTQENFIVIYLNTQNQVIDTEILFKGGLNHCLVDPKTLFRNVLIRNSNAFIIAHNHPSGILKPSDEDIEMTYKLQEAGKIIGVPLLDQIIFNKREFYSLDGHI